MTAIAGRVDTEHPVPSPPIFRRRTRWWIEALVAVVGYELYGFVQGVNNNERAIALRHGRDIIHVERVTHIWVEPTMNAWIAGHRLVAQLANYYYELSHVLITAAVLVWLYRKRPAAYPRWRNALLGMSILAAPLMDTLTRYDTLGAAHAHGLVDLYAALPSLHVAWAVWVAAAVASQVSSRLGLLAFAYPAATSVVVLTTANHYVLDIVAGALLAGMVIVVMTKLLSSRRSAG